MANESNWQVGAILLDEYKIVSALGSGGMGKVWLVRSIASGSLFAVKQALVEEGADRAAFMRELQTWIDLPPHPNIVACRFVKTIGDEVVIFADYIEGGTLASRIAAGRLHDFGRVLDVSIQCAWALKALSSRGLVHQDVKPGNILMTEDDVASITDFGLAKAVSVSLDGQPAAPGVASSGTAVSSGGMTWEYASPEQKRQESLTYSTDVWSWGVSFLDMLVGGIACPLGGDRAASVVETLSAKSDSLKYCVPENLWDLLKCCFACDAAGRPDWDSIIESLLGSYAEVTGSVYARTEPFLPAWRERGEFLRRNITLGTWRDPQYWVELANDAEGNDISADNPVYIAPTVTRHAFAVQDLAYYQEAKERIARVNGVSGGYEWALAEISFEMAHIHSELSDYEGEVNAYDSCVKACSGAIKAAQSSEDEAVPWLALRAHALRDKAIGLSRRGALGDAVEVYVAATMSLRKLLELKPSESSYGLSLCETLRNLGIAYRRAGRPADALSSYDEALRIYGRLREVVPNEFKRTCMMGIAQAQNLAGVALRVLGRHDEARAVYDNCMDGLSKLMQMGTDIDCLLEMARVCDNKSIVMDGVEAEKLCLRAIDIYESLIDGYGMTSLEEDLTRSYYNAGNAALLAACLDRALGYNKEAVDRWGNLVNARGRIDIMSNYLEARMARVQLLAQTGSSDLYKETEMLDNDMSRALDGGVPVNGVLALWPRIREQILG